MRKLTVYIFFLLFFIPQSSFAQNNITVAVAANFIEPFKEIALLFETHTHTKIEPTFSSTGKLFAQITKGAPYDVFLSADEKRPDDLYQQGLSGKPFIYAKGEVVLWTTRKDLCNVANWKKVITRIDVKRLAIANTETAPYGTAAMKALKDTSLWESLQMKLVFPQDIAQTFQYASTGSVDAGFCALSSALSHYEKSGCYLAVQEAPNIVQAACVLNRTKKKAAEKFASFLISAEVDKVKKKYGYK